MTIVFEDSLAQTIWETTYRHNTDLTPDDTIRRVAKAAASVEPTTPLQVEWEEKFTDMLDDFKVTVGGRTYANAGTEWSGTTLINCFVGPMVDYDADSISGIYQVLTQQASTLKSEGGWGMNFSFIRPCGAFIHGVGVETPGAIRFMELFDKSSEIVTSGSGKSSKNSKAKAKIRKGAMMGVLDVWHPDIMDFITAKQTPGRLTKFNLSVNCTNKFMDKVIKVQTLRASGASADEIAQYDSWDLIYPETTHPSYKSEWRGDIEKWVQQGYPVVKYDTVSVTALWDTIMRSTYDRADPGVLFLDRANQMNPLNYAETIFATNPCVTGDTLVSTPNGYIRMDALVEKFKNEGTAEVLTYNITTGDIEFENVVFAGKTRDNADVIELELDDGTTLRLTPDHPVYTENRGYVKASELTTNDVLVCLVEFVASTQRTIIKSATVVDNEDVYDITTTSNHNFFANGIVVHNCGEQMLAHGGVCNLASLNLTMFVNDDLTGFDLPKIKKYVAVMVRFLDNISTLSSAPLPEYVDSLQNKRRVGCGVLGWGSALYMLRTRFGSDKANAMREELMRTIAHAAYEASIDLAEEKGMFPLCQPDQHANGEFIKQIELPQHLVDRIRKVGIRNSALLSCQPTGNTSLLANIVSGGIEPVFMTGYIRTMISPNVPEHLKDVTPNFIKGELHETEFFKWTKEGSDPILRGVDANGVVWKIDSNRGLTKEVLCEDRGVRILKQRGLWDETADYVVTAVELSADEHLSDLQGFAKYIDSAVSKTINVPNDVTFDDFKNIYVTAYQSGYIKGVTTYRMGTMATVLSATDTKTNIDPGEEIILSDVKLPPTAPAVVTKIKAEGKKWYITAVMNEEKNTPYAIFVQTNAVEKDIGTTAVVNVLHNLAVKKGIPQEHIDATVAKMHRDTNTTKIARSVSLLLRHGVLIKNIVTALNSVDCVVGSFVFQISKFLSKYIPDGERIEGQKCGECGSSNIVFSEGCSKCVDCGSSKCG